MDKRPLDGVRVVEFTWAWAGPYAGQLLGFMGAQEIKIEGPKRFDTSREMADAMGGKTKSVEESVRFHLTNANKLDVTLDLTTPKGAELARRIVGVSDVVVENYRPGVMKRFGLDYPVLQQVKPDIIMLSCSATGQTGPRAHYAGFATIFAAMSGLIDLTGYPGGPPGEIRGGIDLRVGTTAAFAVLAALYHRRRTGEGQYIDLSSREAITCLIGDSILGYAISGRLPSRLGNYDDIMAPHNCYRCRGEDKWVSIAVATDEEWQALCHAIGHPDWAEEKRFADAYSRWRNREELDKLIGEWTINYTHYEVTDILQRTGVAAFPSLNSQEIFNDPHLKERGILAEIDHPMIGKRYIVNPPWKFSATPARVTRHGPLLGEHNHYILGELLGMAEEEIKALAKEEIIL